MITKEIFITGEISDFKLVLFSEKSYIWEPQEDMTAYELALCLPILLSAARAAPFHIEKLPDNARRHFREMP